MTDFFYVDTAAVDSSGDGTTRNHSGGTTYAFDSIATALSGLSLADDTIIRCAGSTNDTGQCDFDAVTYNGFSLTVIADDGTDDSAGGGDDGTAFDNNGAHDGDTAFDTTNKYAIVRSSSCVLPARTADTYIIEKVQVQSTATGNYDFTFLLDFGAGTLTIKRGRIQSAGSAPIGYNSGQGEVSATYNIEDNVIQLTSSGQQTLSLDGFGNYANSMVFNIRSNTMYGDSTSGLIEFANPPNTAPVVNFYNNAVYNAGTGGTWVNHSPAGFTFNRSHNAYSDSNGETSEQSNITDTAEWTSPGLTDAADFSVKDSNAQIYEGGTSAEVIDPDIVGTSRKATPDIGAWELAGGGGTADNAVITSASATPLASTDTSTATDNATLTAAVASAIAATDTSSATDSAQTTSVAASVLTSADTSAATDTASLTSASAAVLTATAQAIASDAAAIVTAAATPLTSSETVGGAANNVTDSAVITTVGSATLTATEATTSSDQATITPASVTIRTSAETATALDNALIVNAQGTPIASVESVQTDANITTVTVTPLTSTESTGTAQILFGTPWITPALSGAPNAVPVLSASPEVVAQLKASIQIKPE